MSETITVVPRNINVITSEIRIITRQTQHILLTAVVEIGRRLKEAKELIPHGQWEEYLANEVEYSLSTARNYMKLAEEYGDSLNHQLFGDLGYSKALALLAVPAEDREEFATVHDLDDLSVREIKELSRQLEEAQDAKSELEGQVASARYQLKFLSDQVADHDRVVAALKSAEEVAHGQADRYRNLHSQAVTEKQQAEATVRQLRKDLADAKANPEIPEATVVQIKSEAAAEARQQAMAESTARLTALEAQLAAERQKSAASAQPSKLSDAAAAVFKNDFSRMQDDCRRMFASLLEVRKNDPDLADNLLHAVRVQLRTWLEKTS